MILDLFKSTDTGNIDDLVKSYKNLNIEQSVSAMRSNEVADAEIRAVLSKRGYAQADVEAATATKASNAAKTTNIGLTKLQSAGYKALAVSARIANVALTAGVSILVSMLATGFISWLDDVIHREEKLAEAAEEAKNKIDKINNSFIEQKKTVGDYAEEYAELAQGVDLLTNKNLSLSTEDYKRFLELSNILADSLHTVKKRIDENGNAILDLGGNVDSIVGSLNTLIETQQRLANQDMATEFPAVYADYYNTLEKTNTKIKEQLTEQEKLNKARDVLLNSPSVLYTQKEQDQYEDALDALGFKDYSAYIGQNENGMPGGLVFNVEGLDSNEDVIEKYNALYDQSLDNIQSYEDNLTIKSSELNRIISALLSTDYDFTNNINTAELQAGIDTLFRNFDYSTLPEEIDASDGEQVYNYLKTIYLLPVTRLTDEVQEQLSQVFSKPVSMPDIEYISLVDEMQAYFDEHDIQINLDFLVEDEKDLQVRLDNAISGIATDEIEQDVLINFIATESIDTSDEIENFLKVTNGAKSATEAIEMYNEAMSSPTNYEEIDTEAIHEQLDSIRSAYQTVTSAIEEYKENQYLSLETVQELLQLDDKYLQYLYDENGQLTLNREAYDALTQAQLNEMYVSVANDALNTISNLQSEEQAVKLLEQQIIDTTNANWDFVKSEIAKANAILDAEEAAGGTVDKRREYLNGLAASTEAQFNLLNETAKGIKFEGFYNSYSSGSKKDKDEFSQEFDWIETSVENVTRTITNLNDVLSNTTGFKERLKAYDDLIKADQKLIDTTKKAMSAYEQEWIKASSKISSGYKNKIVSGETFTIETITNETTATNIEEAQDAYDKWQSMLQEYNSAVTQKSEDEKGRVQVLLELEEIRLDILSLENQERMTAVQKNNYIKQEAALKKNILKYNLQLAESEEEKKKLQKEYNEYLKDNKELVYENNKQERDNNISYYDSRVQDIQNAIDLSETKGTQGTETQYTQMNEYLEKQKELERQNYKAALAMRKNATYGTEEWEKYNQEIQTAQDNIYQLTQTQIENNRSILKLPIQALEKNNELLQEELDLLTAKKERIEESISAASNIVQNQIDTLSKEKEAVEEYWDSQIESINEQKEALTEANEEIEQQLALEKAQYELEKAKSQKTTKIYREGQGFVYEADQDSIREAQEELDNQEYNNAIYKLEVQLDDLEKAKEEATSAIDVQINSLELYKERIDAIASGYENMLQLQTLISMFGETAQEKLLSGDLSIIEEMKQVYNETTSQATSLQLQIEANERAIEQIETYADRWNGSSKTIQTAKQLIEQTVSDNTKEIESIEQRVETVKTINDAWEETRLKLEEELGFIQDNQIVAKDDESIVLQERLENIKTFSKKASEYLREITSTLAQAEAKQAELNKVSAEITKTTITTTKPTTSNTTKETTVSSTTTKGKVSTMAKKHSGLESGYVRQAQKKDTFEYIALSELKPKEVPTLLLKGEAVLNPEQISTVLNNMQSSLISGVNIGTANTINALKSITPKTQPENKTIEFNGDIVLQNIHNPDGLAKALKNEFLIKLDQEFYK